MGRAQIKKKSTFIDMTAMSDVTVLLLTFFMLTSTFVKKNQYKLPLRLPYRKSRFRRRMYSRFWLIRKKNIYEPRQAAGYAGCIGEHG